jgi:ribosomal protein S27E
LADIRATIPVVPCPFCGHKTVKYEQARGFVAQCAACEKVLPMVGAMERLDQ